MKFRVYATGPKETREALRAFAPAVDKAARRRLRAIAKDAAEDARSRSSWSRKIPPGISFGMTNRGPYIRYRAAAAEIGRLNELRAAWRHPLFGNRLHWYTQRGRQFLQPAAEGKRGRVLEEMGTAVEEAKEEVGL